MATLRVAQGSGEDIAEMRMGGGVVVGICELRGGERPISELRGGKRRVRDIRLRTMVPFSIWIVHGNPLRLTAFAGTVSKAAPTAFIDAASIDTPRQDCIKGP